MSKLIIYSRPDLKMLFGTVCSVGRQALVMAGDVYDKNEQKGTCLCRVKYPAEKLARLQLMEGEQIGAKITHISVTDTDPPLMSAEAAIIRYTGCFDFPENGRDRAASVIIGQCTDLYIGDEYGTITVKCSPDGNCFQIYDYDPINADLKGQKVIITAIKVKGRLKAQEVMALG